MARWRLTQPHYLNVPGTEWEYKEIDRSTGRQGRKVYLVPRLLSPDDPNDINYPPDLIVCHEGKGMPRDIVFTGPPTPDMEPVDDEATAISKAESKNWKHPIESLPGNFSQSLIASFERQISEIAGQQRSEPQVQNSSVSAKDFESLKAQVADLMSANAELQAQVAEKPARRA